ncbi:MAG: DNA recombination protein RmuC [Pseudomonadota bacterium]
MNLVAYLTADPVTPFAIAAGLVVVLLACLAYAVMQVRGLREEIARLTSERDGLKDEGAETRVRLDDLLERVTRAETQREQAEADTARMRAEGEAARGASVQAQHLQNEAERGRALADQRVVEMQKRMDDWEQARVKSLEHAKAAVLETATHVSNKLITNHKQETEAAKVETEKRVKETTAALVERYEGINRAVAGLNEQLTDNRKTVDTVWRALSSPGGAGYFSEIGLENTLKSFGLLPSRDFLLQATVDGHEDGARLRPDALVFLPNDGALVIDSKASKFLLDMAAADSEEEIREAQENLARTMNLHLKALASKDYRAAVLKAWKQAGHGQGLRRVQTVMYLPNDGALEKVQEADPEFAMKAAQAQIIPVGPAGLTCIVGFARVDIDLGKQASNHEFIVEGTQNLLESVVTMLEHTDKVGGSIKKAADSFQNLTKTVNGRLIPRAKRLADLGVRPAKNKAVPSSLPAYNIAKIDAVIDGEAEELETLNAAITDAAAD